MNSQRARVRAGYGLPERAHPVRRPTSLSRECMQAGHAVVSSVAGGFRYVHGRAAALFSGFSALPAGNRNNGGGFNNRGNNANFWEASENNASNANNRNLNNGNANLNANNNNKTNGFSVRCFRAWGGR